MPTPKKQAKLQFDLIESCRQRGIDPVAEFWRTLALVDDPAIKAKLLLELFAYIYPKRLPVATTVDSIPADNLTHQDIRAILSSDPFLQLPHDPKGTT